MVSGKRCQRSRSAAVRKLVDMEPSSQQTILSSDPPREGWGPRPAGLAWSQFAVSSIKVSLTQHETPILRQHHGEREQHMGCMVGYARVSTSDQDVSLQWEALRRAGCQESHIFCDTASGAHTARPGLAACLQVLAPGDMLVVWRLDRLGRSRDVDRGITATTGGVSLAGRWGHRYYDRLR